MERERMNQVIRELKRQFAGEKLAPEQLIPLPELIESAGLW
jgi:hypothetical protein